MTKSLDKEIIGNEVTIKKDIDEETSEKMVKKGFIPGESYKAIDIKELKNLGPTPNEFNLPNLHIPAETYTEQITIKNTKGYTFSAIRDYFEF